MMDIDRRAKEIYEMSGANMPGTPSPAWEELQPNLRDTFYAIARRYEPTDELQPTTVKRLKEYLGLFPDHTSIYWTKDDPRPIGGFLAMDQAMYHLAKLKDRDQQ